MKAFKARGGKLIIYHGWSDPALNAMQTIAYYDQVLKHDATARDHARLFLVPGMFHCGGGTGLTRPTGAARSRTGWSAGTRPTE